MIISQQTKTLIILMNTFAFRYFVESLSISIQRKKNVGSLVSQRSGNSRSKLSLSTGSWRSLLTQKAHSLELEIPTYEDMEDVGALLSIGTKAGDVFLLDGDLGAGKTCFSRGFVQARTGEMDLRVTSPTYLLSNTYPTGDEGVLIHHMDLYRLSEGSPKALEPLNFGYVLKNCISLIEWPSRLGGLIPSQRLEITFRIDPDGSDHSEEKTRYLILTPHGTEWEERLKAIEDDGYLDDLIVEFEDEE